MVNAAFRVSKLLLHQTVTIEYMMRDWGNLNALLDDITLTCQCTTPRRCKLAGVISRSFAGSRIVILGAQVNLLIKRDGTPKPWVAAATLGPHTTMWIRNPTPFKEHAGLSTHCEYSMREALNQVTASQVEKWRREHA